MNKDKQLINSLVKLVKSKNSKGLKETDRDYIIVRPKVTGVLYILTTEFMDNIFYGGAFGLAEPDKDEAMSYKVFRKELPQNYRMGVFFESLNIPDQYLSVPMVYFLQANKFYAIPEADMSYNEAKIELVLTVKNNEAV